MDANKIAVVLWVRNEENREKQHMYLMALNVPTGYAVEIVEVSEAKYRTEAYEIGRNKTDAKYKVYLDEDAVIVDEDFFAHILNLFNSDEKIGIIGVIGTEKIPTSGVCAWANKRIGKAIDFKGKIFEKGEIIGDYHQTKAVDGFLMVTQYDLPWRKDLFKTDVFWDTAQCADYRRAGYMVVVPKQKDYWCIADWSQEKPYDVASQQIFLNEYSQDIYPLVSVIITTHNRPGYFKEALESVLNQTYRNLEVFITDDSDNTETKELVEEYKKRDSRIIYEYHPDFGFHENWNRGQEYNNPNAIYINWLMDDDKFLPDKIAKMVDCYEQYDGIALVTSYRELIDENGKIISGDGWKPEFNEDTRADGYYMGRELLYSCRNFIGEPTTVLIKKEYLLNGRFGFSGTEGNYLLHDYATWLNCLQYGDLYYICEPLSHFRMHMEQDQRDPATILRCIIGIGMEIKYAWEKKIYIKTYKDLESALMSWLALMIESFRRVRELNFDSAERTKVKKIACELLMLE